MHNLTKHSLVVTFIMSFIGTISATELIVKDLLDTKLISSRAIIQDDFSGLEIEPIVNAFISWMEETHGDIMISPPEKDDAVFYEEVMKGNSKESNVFNSIDLNADGSASDPWEKECRHNFYVIRITSSHPIVKDFDLEGRHIMAFTYTGCVYKFIAVVADRMRDEKMMYATILHELGHMWGLSDNKDGKQSIMNGVWPMGSTCITKKDLREVYALYGKKGMERKDRGCVPK